MVLSLSLRAVKAKAETYKSVPQQVRFLSESWVKGYVYCPDCGRPHIEKYPNNQPVADFVCPGCMEDFELKSMRGALAPVILDGAYRTMLERLRSSQNPNLFLLSYDFPSYDILDFLAIPHSFSCPRSSRKGRRFPARRAARGGSDAISG
jgi:type II restriction enzyme